MHNPSPARAQHLGTRRWAFSTQSMYRLADEHPDIGSYWVAATSRVVGPRNVVLTRWLDGTHSWSLGRAYQTVDGSWAAAPGNWVDGFLPSGMIDDAAWLGVHEAHGNWSA